MGVITGMVHIMHAVVSDRTYEVAVLRAMGFGGVPVAASVVAEAMMLACMGAVVGTCVIWLWLDGHIFIGMTGLSEGAVTLQMFWSGVAWALTIAFIGALMPSIRAANTSVVDAMKT
jgi:putative ABC transport system permease protein